MPGKKITDHQVQKYKQHHLKLSQVAAAAKAGISERSAQRIDRGEALPSQREERAWRTRADPLAPVWESEVVPLLEADGAFNAVTLLEELQRRYPGNRLAEDGFSRVYSVVDGFEGDMSSKAGAR